MKIDSSLYRRCGRFRIARPAINDNPHGMLAIMAHCIVIRAEALAWSDEIQYDALSMLFEKLPVGDKIPKYRVWATTNDGGTAVSAERI